MQTRANLPNSDPEHVLIEGSSEVAFKQFIVIDCLCDEAANKFEVRQVIAVDEGSGIDGIGNPICW